MNADDIIVDGFGEKPFVSTPLVQLAETVALEATCSGFESLGEYQIKQEKERVTKMTEEQTENRTTTVAAITETAMKIAAVLQENEIEFSGIVAVALIVVGVSMAHTLKVPMEVIKNIFTEILVEAHAETGEDVS
jgi:hypothetical protein